VQITQGLLEQLEGKPRAAAARAPQPSTSSQQQGLRCAQPASPVPAAAGLACVNRHRPEWEIARRAGQGRAAARQQR
jgi:hypothetical protein